MENAASIMATPSRTMLVVIIFPNPVNVFRAAIINAPVSAPAPNPDIRKPSVSLSPNNISLAYAGKSTMKGKPNRLSNASEIIRVRMGSD